MQKDNHSKLYFEEYGEIAPITPELFYAGDWRHVGTAIKRKNALLSICYSMSKNEYRYMQNVLQS